MFVYSLICGTWMQFNWPLNFLNFPKWSYFRPFVVSLVISLVVTLRPGDLLVFDAASRGEQRAGRSRSRSTLRIRAPKTTFVQQIEANSQNMFEHVWTSTSTRYQTRFIRVPGDSENPPAISECMCSKCFDFQCAHNEEGICSIWWKHVETHKRILCWSGFGFQRLLRIIQTSWPGSWPHLRIRYSIAGSVQFGFFCQLSILLCYAFATLRNPQETWVTAHAPCTLVEVSLSLSLSLCPASSLPFCAFLCPSLPVASSVWAVKMVRNKLSLQNPSNSSYKPYKRYIHFF